MPFPSSTTTAHNIIKDQRSECAVGRGNIVSRSHGLAIFYSILALLFLLSQATAVVAAPSATSRVQFNIPRQTADDSLPAFGQQANVTVVYPFEDASQHHTNRLYGNYTLKEGIHLLLKGSGLYAEFSEDNHLIISSDDVYGESMMKTKKHILAATIGYFMAGGVWAEENTAQSQEVIDWLIEEVIVTATKRSTGIQDVSMAISALTDEVIDKRNLVGMSDYLPTLPGVSMQDRGAGQNTITIRGIGLGSQGEANSTVGVYFGEVPVTSLGSSGNANQAGNGDLKLVDIERVEVLRGPQGTLYGTGSMGGAVRIIPAGPSLEKVEGKVAARYSNTGEQGGDNTMVQGVINVPIVEDKLAVRAVAYQFNNSGYIDNVANSNPTDNLQTAIDLGGIAKNRGNVASDEYTGFRLTALWQPVDQLAITLGYIHQEVDQEGTPEVNLTFPGKFEQARLRVNNGEDDESLGNEVDIINLVVEYDFDWGSLLSSTSTIDYDAFSEFDRSVGGLSRFGPTESSNAVGVDVFVEELRFTSQFDGPLQILAGLYYEDREQDTSSILRWSGELPAPPTAFPTLVQTAFPNVEQQAFYGELFYDVTEQLTAVIGARYYEYDREQTTLSNGVVRREEEDSDDGQTYKFSLSYKLNEDTLLYGQWSEGFRLGPFQTSVISADDMDGDGLVEFADGTERAIPDTIEPDIVENFEIGLKTALFDSRIILNAAVYRINWEGLPVSLITEARGAAFFFNAGEAQSEGIELEAQLQLTSSLLLELGGSYNDSVLTKDSSLGDSGDNLPGSADTNFRAGLEYRFGLGEYESFIRTDYEYVGEYYHNFSETGQASGDYSQVHLKAGVAINDNVDVDLFVNNLTNADDLTWVVNSLNPDRAHRLRPRTIGVNIGYRF